MNESLQYHAAVNQHADFDHSVLAELIAPRWKQDRSYFTLNERSRGERHCRTAGTLSRRSSPNLCVLAESAQRAAISTVGDGPCVVFGLTHEELVYVAGESQV
jgi:hypothetical protein